MRAELEFHLSEEAEERQAGGLTEEEARSAARRQLGNLTLTEENTRAEWGWTMLERLGRDLRYACRALIQNPGFTTAALLTLSVGIGANVAIFSVVNSVLLRPIPYESPHELMTLWKWRFPGGGLNAGPAEFLAWRDRSQSFSAVAAYRRQSLDVVGTGEPEQIEGLHVTPDFFAVLGIRPARGRLFATGPLASGEKNFVVVTDRLAGTLAGNNYGGVGTSLKIEGQPHIIIGVLPASFTFGNDTPDVYLPLAVGESSPMGNSLSVIARLKPGVQRDTAEAELAVIGAQAQAGAGKASSMNPSVVPLQSELIGDARSLLLPIFGAVGCVLLIACATLANLQLARAAVRRKEMTIRAALGAGRRRLIAQMLIESVVLSLAGGFVSLAMTKCLLMLLVSARPKGLPRIDEVSIDPYSLGFALLLSIATGILFGLAPALRASRVDLEAALKEEGRGAASRSRTWLRNGLVVAEVALSLILLTGAGLLLNSFVRLISVDPGFQADGRLTMRIALPEHAYPGGRQVTDFLHQAVAKVLAVPGVQQVGTADYLPLGRGVAHTGFSLRADSKIGPNGMGAGEGWNVRAIYYVSPGYLAAMGTPLVRGRMFTDRDNQAGAPPVVMVNRAFAREFLSEGDPIGRRVHLARPDLWCTVIGVAEDMKNGGLGDNQLWLSKPPSASIYLPQAQRPDFMYEPPWNSGRSAYLVAHTSGDPMKAAGAIRRAIWAVAPHQPIADIKTMDTRVMESVATRRLGLWPLLIFAVLALALAIGGIFGLVAYAVAQRTREVGIRMALGATRANVLLLAMKDSMRLAIVGIAVGLVGGQWLIQALASQLFEISATDPATYSAVVAVLLLSVAAASYLPARRATLVDPTTALRHD